MPVVHGRIIELRRPVECLCLPLPCLGTLSIPDLVITFEPGNSFGQILSSAESRGINGNGNRIYDCFSMRNSASFRKIAIDVFTGVFFLDKYGNRESA